MDKVRAEFEAWAAAHRGSYDTYMDYGYAAWQAARQPERGEAVARLLHWVGPKHLRVVSPVARTYAEYSSAQASKDECWREGERLYTNPPAADARVALSVWYGAMPESNGKINWTAILVRDGDIASGYTFARSEYEDRVRYEADSMRFIIGEVAERPDLMAYDPDKHSGYVYPPTAADARVAELEARLAVKRSACEVQGLLVKAGHQRIAALEAQLAEREAERAEQWRLRRDAEADRDTAKAVAAELRCQLTAIREREGRLREALEFLLTDINDLARASSGVAGLHVSGEIVTWNDLLLGGAHNIWLASIADAQSIISEVDSHDR